MPKAQKTPDWLQDHSNDGQAAGPQYVQQREEKRRRHPCEDDDDRKSKGIKWGPVALLVLLVLPAAAPTLIDVVSKCAPPPVSRPPDSRLLRHARSRSRPQAAGHGRDLDALVRVQSEQVPAVSAGAPRSSPPRPHRRPFTRDAIAQEFYADYAPEKLGNLDATLLKYEGREKAMFATLAKKYGKQANYAKCASSKSKK